MATAKFDEYAANYSALHNQNLATSGEPLEYFSEYKRACLARLNAPPNEPLLDYGCGVGNVLLALARYFTQAHGYDPSAESILVAKQRIPSATLYSDVTQVPDGYFSTVVLSGVLHHVPRPERPSVLGLIRQKLKPGGRLFVFEHNPLNPLTRHAVATCPFDDDADLLRAGKITRLLKEAELKQIRREYIVFFPRMLAPLRPFEPRLSWLPLGAQTMVVGTR
jgi:2-polyprenyl-3-methyl-5-hydroxy-6-metoxy-1,4-benzoquinol methylase